MALPDWPSGLPYTPEERSFRRALKRTVIATDVEDGPPIMRRQSQTDIRQFSYELVLTRDEKETFEAFVETSLDGGTGHFIMPVPLTRGDEYVERRCYLDGGRWEDTELHENILVTFTLCVFTAEP